MGITHADFFRRLPSAVNFAPLTVRGARADIEVQAGTVSISLGAEQRRTIALLSLPKTVVYFCFRGLSRAEVDVFMHRFELYYRRGGG